MNKYLQNNKGYSLLLAICVILIFSILSLSLITLTTNGVAKNNTREDITLAKDLADKGLGFIIEDVQKTLENGIQNTAMNKIRFSFFLEETLNNPKISCSEGIEISGDSSDSFTKMCIERVSMVSQDEKDKYKRLVIFKSTGRANNQTQTVEANVTMGTDLIPDQLNYVVSTNHNENNKGNNNGNLFLHGGVDINGDLKVDGNLIVSRFNYSASQLNTSDYSWRNDSPTKTNLFRNSSVAKLIMKAKDNKEPSKNKYVYYLNEKNNITANDHFSLTRLNNSKYYSKYDPTSENHFNSITSLFNNNNFDIINKTLPPDILNVTEKIDAYKNIYKSSDVQLIKTSDFSRAKINYNKPVLVANEKFEERCIEWNTKNKCKRTDYFPYLENQNMIIKNKDKVDISGTYYITGDLKINNVDLYSNALIYVDGEVEIMNSTLNSLNNGTLVIFSNNRIVIGNISLNLDKPSLIKGFFYSKGDIDLYGVGSHIYLDGGISANNIKLNAIRNSDRSSRLTLRYNHDIIETFEEFSRDEKDLAITKINEPIVLLRK